VTPSGFAVAQISPLSHAHVSDYATKMVVPRHHGCSGSTIDFNLISSPTTPQSSSSTTAVHSRKGSYDDLALKNPLSEGYGVIPAISEVKTVERMKWRLAAGYFAFFMCGWGDGGKLIGDNQGLTSIDIDFPVTGTVLPCELCLCVYRTVELTDALSLHGRLSY
jgi:hypothetical protein